MRELRPGAPPVLTGGRERLTNSVCAVDYALGGGSSGARIWEGGVRTTCGGTGEGDASGACNSCASDATAIGAQGAIDWQPPGAQGSSHGARSWEGASSDRSRAVPDMSIPAMFMPARSGTDMSIAAIAPSDDCSIAGITQAKPLPTHITWARRRFTRSAAIRRAWRMT